MKAKQVYNNVFTVAALQLAVFFYIYSVPLKGLPGGIGSRILLTLFGIMLLTVQTFKRYVANRIRVSGQIVLLVALFAGVVFISAFSMFINRTDDPAFIKYAGSFMYILLSGYFVAWLFGKVYQTPTFSIVGNHIIIAGLMQVLISLGMFLSPPLYDILMAIQNIDQLTDERLGAIAYCGFQIDRIWINFLWIWHNTRVYDLPAGYTTPAKAAQHVYDLFLYRCIYPVICIGYYDGEDNADRNDFGVYPACMACLGWPCGCVKKRIPVWWQLCADPAAAGFYDIFSVGGVSGAVIECYRVCFRDIYQLRKR
jgi:hypothetical protein